MARSIGSTSWSQKSSSSHNFWNHLIFFFTSKRRYKIPEITISMAVALICWPQSLTGWVGGTKWTVCGARKSLWRSTLFLFLGLNVNPKIGYSICNLEAPLPMICDINLGSWNNHFQQEGCLLTKTWIYSDHGKIRYMDIKYVYNLCVQFVHICAVGTFEIEETI